jgi:hypothetical protein
MTNFIRAGDLDQGTYPMYASELYAMIIHGDCPTKGSKQLQKLVNLCTGLPSLHQCPCGTDATSESCNLNPN